MDARSPETTGAEAPEPSEPPREKPDGALRIALLQMAAHGNDRRANLETAVQACRQVAARDADIALFPEMFSIGYTGFRGTDEDTVRTWQAQAEDRDGPYLTRLRELARDLNLAIAATYLEKRTGEAPRNAVSLIDRRGEILLTYAKMHTCDFAAFEASCTPGDDFRVAELETTAGSVRVGAMICYDREFPESARILMLKGAEIILTPNACRLDDLRVNQFQSRAYENAVAVFMTNYPGEPNGGRSVAFAADGTHLAEAGAEEEILTVDLSLSELRGYRARTVWGNAFRRPRRYGLLTDPAVAPEFERRNGFGEPFRRERR